MQPAAPSPVRAPRPASWAALVVVGLLATAAGLFAPQLLPDEKTDTPSARSEAPSAADGLAYMPPAWPEPPSIRGLLVRLSVGTLLVLGLSVGTLWYGKRWLQGQAAAGQVGGELRLVETLHLGGRCSLHLVQLASGQVLVGADASGIKTVVPLPESFEALLPETAERLEGSPRHA